MARYSTDGKVAYMEDADDTGMPFPNGPRTYAGSVAPSPTKEKPNTDSTIHPAALVPRRDSKIKPKEKERTANKKVTMMRPPPKHAKTTPIIQSSSIPRRSSRDESSFYGVDSTLVTPAQTSRPRAHTTRPSSYYGPSSRPPLTNPRFYPQPLPAAPAPMPPTSYPPQTWAAAGNVSYPMGPPPPQMHHMHQMPAPMGPPMAAHPSDYFGRQHMQLASRFNRPASAMGQRPPPPPPPGYYGPDHHQNDHDDDDDDDDDEEEVEERLPVVPRRMSLRARTNNTNREKDRMHMPPPPPPRPMSTRPMNSRPSPSPFAPPPPQPRNFDDDAFEGDGSLYQEVSYPDPSSFQGPLVHRARRLSISGRGTPAPYELAPYSTEVATSSSRRSSGYFGNASSSLISRYEDKLRHASSYQDEINGGPSLRLTAESLKRATKQGLASSHSTGSSESQEESDWRQSATTRTTRSSNEEDVTIRVKGSAVLKVGGAEMKCQDGAEINISSSRGSAGIRGSSDQSSYAEYDDRHTRFERPTLRARASSQAGSHSRTLPRLDAPPLPTPMYHYDYPPSARYPPPSATPYYGGYI